MTYRGVDIPPTSRCALDALELLSKKWHPVVVVVLDHHGPLGFNDLLDTIPDVSGKVLSGALEALQDSGLVERRVVNESPLRVEYSLSEAGDEMGPVFEALGEWGQCHIENTTATVLLADGDRRITSMYREWLADRYAVVRAHDDGELNDRLADGVDVLLLDEGLPGTDPRERLSDLRDGCRTILLVGDRPPFDHLDAACDDVLRKPLVRETALEAIDAQLSARNESPQRRRLRSLSARLSLFEAVYAPDRLAASERYRAVSERSEELAETLAADETDGDR